MLKPKEDKLIVKQFKDGSSNFWCDGVHYSLNKNGSVSFCAGGIDTDEKRDAVLSFIRRNKKSYVPRETCIFEREEKEYKAIFTFGKHINKSVEEVKAIDIKWLKWCRDNFQFSSAQKELKEQIEEILKT